MLILFLQILEVFKYPPNALAMAEELNDQQAAACSSNYYFRVDARLNTVTTNIPSTNFTCETLYGSLSIYGYNSSYVDHVPTLIKSLKTITGTLSLNYVDDYPSLLDGVKRVSSFDIRSNKFNNLWTMYQLEMITSSISISYSYNVQLSFPNLNQLGNWYIYMLPHYYH